MRLGGLDALREALGGRDANGRFVVGRTYASALKQAAGAKGCRLFDIDAVVQWRKDRPAWRITEVFPHRPSKSQKRKELTP